MHLRWACFFLSLLVAWPSDVRAAKSTSPAEPVWEIESLEPGEFDYHLDDGRVILNDRFRITFEEQGERAFIIADRGRLDQTAGEIFAEGNVTLQNQDRVVTSDRLFYNFQTRAMQTDNFRAGQAPFFVEGTNIKGDATSNRYSADDVWLTTDDRSDPVLRLRTRHLSIVPGKYVEARGATLYAGKVPVFYFPYYRHRLDRPPNQWGLTPGYRRSQLDHDAAGFVPGDHRLHRPFDTAAHHAGYERLAVALEIRAAHTGSLDLQDHIARARLRVGKLTQLGPALANKYDTLHLPFSQRLRAALFRVIKALYFQTGYHHCA